MTLRRWLVVGLLLAPGLGLILVLIGTVVFIAVAQSFGYYDLSGRQEISLGYWAGMFNRKVFSQSVAYSLYIGTISAVLSVALAYPRCSTVGRRCASSVLG